MATNLRREMQKSSAILKHQSLYKSSTPPWKETYRKRCFERLKKSKDKFMERYRGDLSKDSECADQSSQIVRDLMVDEWKQLTHEHTNLPPIREGAMDLDLEVMEDDMDSVLTTFEEIRAELLKEEQQILCEYEAGLSFDEQSFHATVEYMAHRQVICPVCQKDCLIQHKSIILCRCGLRIDTEQDCITLENVKENLESGLGMHNGTCEATPEFGAVNMAGAGITNLIMTCQVCDFMFIVV